MPLIIEVMDTPDMRRSLNIAQNLLSKWLVFGGLESDPEYITLRELITALRAARDRT